MPVEPFTKSGPHENSGGNAWVCKECGNSTRLATCPYCDMKRGQEASERVEIKAAAAEKLRVLAENDPKAYALMMDAASVGAVQAIRVAADAAKQRIAMLMVEGVSAEEAQILVRGEYAGVIDAFHTMMDMHGEGVTEMAASIATPAELPDPDLIPGELGDAVDTTPAQRDVALGRAHKEMPGVKRPHHAPIPDEKHVDASPNGVTYG